MCSGLNTDRRIDIPPGAGPGALRGWHDLVYRGLEVGLGRASPRLRAWLSWRLDAGAHRLVNSIIATLVHPGDTVLDLGASWGLFTHRLGRAVGKDGRVLAFEPNELLAPSLEAVRARRANVSIHAVALSDVSGTAELHVPVLERVAVPVRRTRDIHPMGSLNVPENRAEMPHRTTTIDVRCLDEIVGAEQVAFIKCDVEGHEGAVLRGADALLRRWRPTILVEVEQRHQGADISGVFDQLLAYGYDGYVLAQRGLRPLEEFDVWRDQVRFLRPHAVFSAAPAGYLHNFLFVDPHTDVSGLMSRTPISPA